jgi:hypothetical protein
LSVGGVGGKQNSDALERNSGGASTLPAIGLVMRLDAQAAAAQYSDGEAVTWWQDVSGEGADAIGSGSSAPTIVSSAINGKAAVRFDGVDDYLRLPAGFSDFTAGLSLYVVMRPSGLESRFKVLALGAAAGQYNLLLGRAATTEGLQYATGQGRADAGTLETAEGLAENDAALYSVLQESGAPNTSSFAEISRNGVALFGQNVSVPQAQRRDLNYIGKGFEKDEQLRGDIAEIILYNRMLTPEEQETVRDYAARKYGLAVQ